MSATAHIAGGRPVFTVNPKRLLIGFGAFLSGFVINEPAPYELYMAGLIGIWFLFGLRISRTTGLLLALLLIFKGFLPSFLR